METSKPNENEQKVSSGERNKENTEYHAEEAVEKLNLKRNEDEKRLADLHNSSIGIVKECVSFLEEIQIDLHNHMNGIFEEKMNTLASTMDRVGNLDKELSEIKTFLGNLCNEVLSEQNT